MRPVVRFLSDELIEKIISEAREVLCKLGVEIHNNHILSMLQENGAKVKMDDEGDHWSPWQEDAGPGQPPSSILGRLQPSAEGIELAREVWKEIGYSEEP